jgi:general nucleoside transport system permease protein
MMPIRLEPRGQASRPMLYLTPLLAVVLTLVAGFILFAALGFDPARGIYAYFIDPVTTKRGVGELIVKATPLTLVAIGLAIGFRANVWNIGAEGQLTVGAITGGGVHLALYGTTGWWLLPAMVIGGILGGMAWSAIVAFLRTRFHASEILTSLMLTYVALLLLQYLVHGPYRDPEGFAFPESRLFDADAMFPIIVEGTRVNVGTILALLIAAGAWLVMARAFIGFQIRVIGLTPLAAGYAGFNERRIIWLTLLVSGGLAGLAGVNEVAGPIGQITGTVSPGYGFTAIIVAFLGRLHPVGIVLAALVMALSFIGAESAQIALGLPKAIGGVFQGMLLFFLLASDVLVRYRIRFARTEAA